MKCRHFGIILLLLLIGAIVIAGCTTPQPNSTPITTVTTPPHGTQGSILVYSGAGLKAPMEEIGHLFAQKHGIDVQYTYGGSGMLITQMNLTRKGDVFIPGSTVEYNTAKNQSLVGPYQLVAYHVPLIAVQKGNPKNITTLQDFARPGLKIALGDINATAVGKAGAKMFKKLNITDAVEKNVITRTPTINELVVIMNTGQADASLLTLDNVNPNTMDSITIPTSINEVLVVPVGVTTFTENQESARKFVDFVSSTEGKAVFAKHGFPMYPDAAYAGVKV
jgi:molybdate transport system substrate-binding protein